MTAVNSRHVHRMQRGVAQLRVAAVVLTAGVLWFADPSYLPAGARLTVVLGVALLYAAGVAIAEPFRQLPAVWWDAFSGLIDWGFITALILATGGVRSQFYLLYFFLMVSVAMRCELRAVLLSGVGTVVGYVFIVVVSAKAGALGLHDASFRTGCLMLFSLGSAILAHEVGRHLRARVHAEARCRAVEEMTATVSHDLARPFAAIAGLVDVLLDSGADVLSPAQRTLLRRVSLNAEQGGSLAASLRDAEVIEQGHQPFRPALVDVNAIVRCVVEAQACQAEAKHISVALDLDQQLPQTLLDDHLIQRLVANLLNNALKFAPTHGAVRVTTGRRHAQLVIEVWDNGPDVPAALWASLFDKFVREEGSPGIGLGLYISKSIVDLHQGRILRRQVGEGVAFVVELPFAPCAQAAPPAPGLEAEQACGWQPPVGFGIARPA
jgi:signal transduction histidine kinase